MNNIVNRLLIVFRFFFFFLIFWKIIKRFKQQTRILVTDTAMLSREKTKP